MSKKQVLLTKWFRSQKFSTHIRSYDCMYPKNRSHLCLYAMEQNDSVLEIFQNVQTELGQIFLDCSSAAVGLLERHLLFLRELLFLSDSSKVISKY